MARVQTISQNKYLKRLAFTLAEVLITLGIIGIVAEMTIPTLVQNTQEKVTVVSLKKAYSMLTQAYTMAVTDNGTPDTWGFTADGAGAVTMMNVVKPYFRVTQDCGTGGTCFSGDDYKHMNGSSRGTINGDTGLAKVRLADGTLWAVAITSATCNTDFGSTLTGCGYFYVDVNGFKKPNTVGKDFFLMYITKDGIIPVGMPTDNTMRFSDNCSTNSGWGCAGWVIYNENMDYLKCPASLSWGGQTKCS